MVTSQHSDQRRSSSRAFWQSALQTFREKCAKYVAEDQCSTRDEEHPILILGCRYVDSMQVKCWIEANTEMCSSGAAPIFSIFLIICLKLVTVMVKN